MNSRTQHGEGVDGETVCYQERLWPGVGGCLFVLLMTASVGIAYGHAYGRIVGLAVGILVTTVAIGLMLVNSPIVRVDDRVLRVGKARLPLCYIGNVRRLDEAATQAAFREHLHHQAFLTLRSWIKESVIVTVTDTQDPHPYWQISSRRSTALTAAIEQAVTKSGGRNE